MLKDKARVMTGKDMERVLKRMSHEIIEKNRGLGDMVIVGIQRRGVYLANRIRDILTAIESVRIPTGVLDITLYRDDLTLLHDQPVVHSTSIPEDNIEKDDSYRTVFGLLFHLFGPEGWVYHGV